LQREHYKSDWHNYNLKRKISGKEPIDEKIFLERVVNKSKIEDNSTVDDDDDYNSQESEESDFSSSTDDEEIEKIPEEEQPNLNTSKIILTNSKKERFSIWKQLLVNNKSADRGVQEYQQDALLHLNTLVNGNGMWAIFLCTASHFGGAIFEKGEVIMHKTFARYVVRQKQGKRQSTMDAQSGFNHRSAGASLRRYNEQRLKEEIRKLISETWRYELRKCDIIFLQAPGILNKATFFQAPGAPLDKLDPRIRNIPFNTYKPTFAEVKRVYNQLVSVDLLDRTFENVSEVMTKVLKKNKRKAKPKKKVEKVEIVES